MLEYWLWLAHRPGLSDHRKLALLEMFGSPECVFHAADAEYRLIEGMTSAGLEALHDKNLSLYRQALDICRRERIRIVTIGDADYPIRLKSIFDPPLVLYYKGTLPHFDELPAIGVVGTRRCSAYGQTTAREIGLEITRCGGLVVSGLAVGIDGAAMGGAMLEGGSAVGVLGCGADLVYPPANRKLFEKTVQQGCILSEFLPGTEPYRWNFPKRNRVISGLCCGVVVVEAPEKSGALITARCALEQGKDVFAVPGNVDLASFAGSNGLLREGAGTVSCGWDVMSEYQSRFPDKIRRVQRPISSAQASEELVRTSKRTEQTLPILRKKPEAVKKDIDIGAAAPYSDRIPTRQGLSAEEQAVIAAIGAEERLVDDVIAECRLSTGRMIAIMTVLEMKGIVRRLPGKRIALRR